MTTQQKQDNLKVSYEQFLIATRQTLAIFEARAVDLMAEALNNQNYEGLGEKAIDVMASSNIIGRRISESQNHLAGNC